MGKGKRDDHIYNIYTFPSHNVHVDALYPSHIAKDAEDDKPGIQTGQGIANSHENGISAKTDKRMVKLSSRNIRFNNILLQTSCDKVFHSEHSLIKLYSTQLLLRI